jgi:thiol:disulfide interchange protein DsbD
MAVFLGPVFAIRDIQSDLFRAKQALQKNQALGEKLSGKPVKPAQLAEAAKYYDEAFIIAWGAAEENPQSAEAHRYVGLILCTAYRPVVIETNASGIPKTTVLLQGSAKDCAQGLEELRKAVALALEPTACQLDYAQALLVCGDTKASQEEVLPLWEQRESLTQQQTLQCARLLAAIARADRAPELERRWLREILKLDPKDKVASERFAELVPSDPTVVTWLTYENGLALAGQVQKPILVDFTAEWCGWCKKLDKDVFAAADFISFSQNFVCVRVDSDARSDLTRRYRIEGYPTALVLDASGNELQRIVGYMGLKDYLARLKQSLSPR